MSVVVDGQGSGHGRGLSQWGSYGSAVNRGWSWQQILDHYYGGTQAGPSGNSPIRVRLFALDDAPATGVVSTGGAAAWNGVQYSSVQARETSPNVYDIYGAPDLRCPTSADGWTVVALGVPGPVTFTTPLDETSAPAGEVLGLCQPNGTVVHYRGAITALNDAGGVNRTVNRTLVENYLRGVLSREVSTSWGNAGGGAGMNALKAQAVAARSFVLSQGRYAYAETCDSSSCQVYGGSAFRASPTAATSHPGVQVCETGNRTFECTNTNRAVVDTAGVVRRWPSGGIVSTDYSSSHGPRSAGGPFPAVDDTASNVPQNTSYLWNRSLNAATIAARYGLGQLTAATTERDPGTAYDGKWGNRVRLQGTTREVLVSAWDFKTAFGLPSLGFVISSVTPA